MSAEQRSNGDLAKSVAAGCVGDFGLLVQRYQDAVMGYLLTMVGNFHLAEDLSQDVFVAAYRGIRSLQDPTRFGAWLRGICRRLAQNAVRSTARRKEVYREGESRCCGDGVLKGQDTAACRNELKDAVLEAIGRLPTATKETVTLFYMNGYTCEEVADFLDVSADAVKSRLKYGREKLKGELLHMVEQVLKTNRLPDDFSKTIVRLVSSESDLKKAAEYLSYMSSRECPEVFKTLENAKQHNVLVMETDCAIDGAAACKSVTLNIGHTPVPTIQVWEMADEGGDVGSPAFVRNTLAFFEHARKRGDCLALAHGDHYNHPRCGYIPCFYHPLARIPIETAMRLSPEASVRPARENEQKEAQEMFAHDLYATKMGCGGMSARLTHAVESKDRKLGYFALLRGDGAFWPKVWTPRITVSNRHAALAVLRFLADRHADVGEDEIHIFQSFLTVIGKTVMELGGTCELRGTWHDVGQDEELVAILDLTKLSGVLEPEFSMRIRGAGVPKTEASFSLEMEGAVVGFVAKNGRVRVVPERRPRHCVLPRWMLTRLYMGYHSGAELLRDCDVTLSGNEARLFEALFPKLWPCSVPDFNFWFGGVPSREHSEKKQREIRAIEWPWLATRA